MIFSQTRRTPLLLTVLIACLWGCHGRMLSGEDETSLQAILDTFYGSEGPEDTLMDPLILAGDRIVPLVLKEIRNKSMPRRRYAIGFLGNGSYKQAIPVLEAILEDASEEGYFRGDALQSIYMIDESRGRELTQKYDHLDDYLGEIARRIIDRDPTLTKRRTYWDAVVGRHN